MPRIEKWTVVQHSAFGYHGDPLFEKGLETREITGISTINRVQRAGGLVFDDYGTADDFAMEAMYPDGHEEPMTQAGLVPRAQGTFSDRLIDGLAIYIPVRKVVG